MIPDYTSLGLYDLQAIVPTNGRQRHAIDRAIKYLVAVQDRDICAADGLNKYELANMDSKLESLERLAFWAMNAYRHSVECMPYTYDENHRPFEYEGYDPDTNYRDIYSAYSALYHAAADQLNAINDRLVAAYKNAIYSVSWSDLMNTPDGIEYRAIEDSARAFYRLMGYPGYWENWQK